MLAEQEAVLCYQRQGQLSEMYWSYEVGILVVLG